PEETVPPEKLIENLGDPDFATRERASAALKALGVPALPAVHKALEHPDAEVRRRAEALLPVLKAKAAFVPKRVSIKPGKMSLADTLQVIGAQTGCQLAIDTPGEDDAGDFGISNATFWEAVERASRVTGRTISTSEFFKEVRLKPAKVRPPFVHLDGV